MFIQKSPRYIKSITIPDNRQEKEMIAGGNSGTVYSSFDTSRLYSASMECLADLELQNLCTPHKDPLFSDQLY